MKWIQNLVSDPSGDPSTMRVATLMIVAAVLAQWLYLTFHTGQAQPLDWQQVGLVVGALGAKAFQVGKENSTTPPAAPTVAPSVTKP